MIGNRLDKLFQNAKLLSFFLECKNTDARGWPFMSFKIKEGTLILEFQSLGSTRPSLNVLYKDVRAIENYLKSMSMIVDVLNQDN